MEFFWVEDNKGREKEEHYQLRDSKNIRTEDNTERMSSIFMSYSVNVITSSSVFYILKFYQRNRLVIFIILWAR